MAKKEIYGSGLVRKLSRLEPKMRLKTTCAIKKNQD